MLDDLVECRLCGRKFKYINYRHMAYHGLTTAQYREQFPDAPVASKSFVDGFIESRMDDETEAKRKAAAAEALKNPEVLARRADAIRKSYSTEEARAMCRERALVATHTETARKHYSEASKRRWADPEYKARVGARISIGKQAEEAKQRYHESMARVYARPGYKEKVSASHLKKWADLEYRARMVPIIAEANRRPEKRLKESIRVTQAMVEGRLPLLGKRGIRGKFFSAKNNRSLNYRSSYELAAFHVLEQLSVVASYSHEPLRIPYVDQDGQERNYVPDILVKYTNGNMELIEVKPKWNLISVENEVKFAAARKLCDDLGWSFSVWTEDQLRMS